MVVQSWHAAPPMPHAVSMVAVRQVFVESQQPAHEGSHGAPPLSRFSLEATPLPSLGLLPAPLLLPPPLPLLPPELEPGLPPLSSPLSPPDEPPPVAPSEAAKP